MKILSRYVLRQFIPIFGLALLAGVGIYLVIDFFEKIDNLLEKHVPSEDILAYFIYKVPYILTQSIPVAALLGALIALGILKKNRELIAMEAAGIDPRRYVKPLLLSALVLSVCHFGIDETFARAWTQRAQQIWYQQVEERSGALAWTQENIWYHGADIIYQIRLYDKASRSLERVSLFYLEHPFRLTQRIDAKRIRWKENVWEAEEALMLRFDGPEIHQEWFPRKILALAETPEDFGRLEAMPEELSWMDLYRYSARIQSEGYNATPYIVALNLRLAMALSSVVLVLLGVTTILTRGQYGGIAFSVGIAVGVTALYFTAMHLGSALAFAGILPAFLGVWAGNAIFVAASAYMWISRGW